ncbi:MAG: type II secretion system F family protein [Actinomycetaceae bacterium]|nr:type II secretion system F family protein [Actinomycetaceae bacterium]
MIPAIVGAIAGLGLALVLAALSQRTSLSSRILPYTDEGWRSRDSNLRQTIGRWASGLLDGLGSTNASVLRRCQTLGTLTPRQFRTAQAQWAGLGFLGGCLCSAATLARGGNLAVGAVLMLGGLLGGAICADARLTRRVRDKEARLTQELPDVAELLALAVGAGESIRTALERVVGIGRGQLVFELERTLGFVRAGSSLAHALAGLARRSPSASVVRLAEALIAAMERGTSVAGVLRSQADDARDAAHRSLLEAGGKKEISMMVPVVFLILPVTVLFTLFPGLMAMSDIN